MSCRQKELLCKCLVGRTINCVRVLQTELFSTYIVLVVFCFYIVQCLLCIFFSNKNYVHCTCCTNFPIKKQLSVHSVHVLQARTMHIVHVVLIFQSKKYCTVHSLHVLQSRAMYIVHVV